MAPVRAPALLPALAFVAALASAPGLARPPHPALPVVAALLAVAIGGRASRVVAAAALGLAWGVAARAPIEDSTWDRDRPVALSGRLCSPWSESHGGRNARLCDALVTQGTRSVRLGEPVGLAAPLAPPRVAFGSRIVARGYLDRAPPLANAEPAPAGRWRLRVKSAVFLALEASPDLWDRVAAVSRTTVDAALRRGGLERPGVRLARALLLGDLSSLPGAWRRALRRTGLLHLIAVSGMHVALLAAAVAALGAWSRRPVRGLALAIGVLGYLGLVGPQPSILRAAVMALVALAALSLARPQAGLQVFAVALVALATVDPRILGDLGFRLSASATLGLLVRFPGGGAQGAKRSAWREVLVASIAAQAATAVWIVPAFHQLPLAAPLWNLLAIPWSILALAAAAAWTGLAVAAPAIAQGTVALLDPFAWPLAGLARVRPEPWLNLPADLEGPAVALVVAVAVGLAARRARAASLCALLVCAQPRLPPTAPPRVTIGFLDVGQGDAALLSDDRVAILVDGGGQRGRDLAAAALIPALVERGRATLDVAILTHSDFDHCGGLLDLAGSVAIGELWLREDLARAPCVTELEREVGGSIRVVRPGERLTRGRFAIEVLPNGAAARSENDRSLTVAVSALGRRILLAADLEEAGERELGRLAPASLRSDLLKVAHHGSRSSTSEAFLALVRPRYAVISAGLGNLYGHPASATLSHLAAAGARVARTDLQGEVRFEWGSASPMLLRLVADPKVP